MCWQESLSSPGCGHQEPCSQRSQTVEGRKALVYPPGTHLQLGEGIIASLESETAETVDSKPKTTVPGRPGGSVPCSMIQSTIKRLGY